MDFPKNGTEPNMVEVQRTMEEFKRVYAPKLEVSFEEWLEKFLPEIRFDREWAKAVQGNLRSRGINALVFKEKDHFWLGIDKYNPELDVPRPPMSEDIVASLFAQGYALMEGSLGYAVFAKGTEIQVIGAYIPLPGEEDEDEGLTIGDIGKK